MPDVQRVIESAYDEQPCPPAATPKTRDGYPLLSSHMKRSRDQAMFRIPADVAATRSARFRSGRIELLVAQFLSEFIHCAFHVFAGNRSQLPNVAYPRVADVHYPCDSHFIRALRNPCKINQSICSPSCGVGDDHAVCDTVSKIREFICNAQLLFDDFIVGFKEVSKRLVICERVLIDAVGQAPVIESVRRW